MSVNAPDRWPRLGDPRLLARLAVPDEAFLDHILGHPPPPPPLADAPLPERIAHAVGYPWSRPEQACRLVGDRVEPDDGPIADGVLRWPLVAIGANGDPARLAQKLAGLPVEPLRIVPATLHDFDVCAVSLPTSYGAMAAGLASSPSTRVTVTLLQVTEAQFERLTLTEFGYRPVHLEGITLTTWAGEVIDAGYAYAHRIGLLARDDGAPVALAAVPAAGRTLTAMTQRELLDLVARRTLDPAADADDLLGRLFADYTGFVGAHFPGLRAATLRPVLPGACAPPPDADAREHG